MITRHRRYLTGGGLGVYIKDDVFAEARWFDIHCIRLVDTVMLMLPYIQQLREDSANDLLNYIFTSCRALDLPAPKESWVNSDLPVLRLYYHIMKSTQFNKTPATILLTKVKIEGNYVTIVDSDGQGDNW